MRSLRVLVVDDDPDTCSFLHAVFEAEGHQCDAFLCASDAELHFRNNRADLALVDVYLGTGNGVDLVQRLRELQPDLHAVVMTAQVSLETAARSLAEGAVDYISKPLDISRIRELCRRTAELARHDARRSQAESTSTALQHRDGGEKSAHAGSLQGHWAGRFQQCKCVDHRGQRHGKRTGGARDSSALEACGAAIHTGQLRIPHRNHSGKRVVRTREGSLHRRRPAAQRTGGSQHWRNSLPG